MAKNENQQEAVVAEAVGKTEKFFQENGKYVMVGLLAVVIVVVAGYFYKSVIIDGNAEKASEMIVEAQERFGVENPDFVLALNGDDNGAGFLDVVEQYGSTPAGNLAKHYAGICYLRTGDLGIIDKQGNIFIKGRSKCMILTASGQNIYPEEVEAVLNTMPHIAESLIVERNKHLVALVALTADDLALDEATITEALEQSRIEANLLLPSYSQITKIEVVREGFAHTPKHSIKRFLYK